MLRSSHFELKLVVVTGAALFCLALLISLVLASPTQATPEYGVLTVGNDTDASGLPCTSTDDCNLRSAIEYANTHGGDWAIVFTSGIHTFTLGSPLTISADAITITANAGQTVFINANNNGQAFIIYGSGVRLNNLYIYGSTAGTANIWIGSSAQGMVLSNNYIGTYPTNSGSVDCEVSLNSHSGVYINSTGAVAAGSARAWIYGNTISCNKGIPGNGIHILSDHVVIGANATGAANANYIGYNRGDGVHIAGSGYNYNTIRNSIIGHNQNGIVISATAKYNSVLTNTISTNTNVGVFLTGVGTDYNYVRANTIREQSNTGVHIDAGARYNEIGCGLLGGSSASGNVISANDREGVYLSGANTMNNYVHCNRIGTSADGLSDDGNKGNGVVLTNGARGNFIGTTVAGRNIIAGNDVNGVEIVAGAHDNLVQANYIGVNAAEQPLSNTLSGVAIYAGAYLNLIGGSDVSNLNTISHNGIYGIYIAGSGTTTNTVKYNHIMSNGDNGVTVQEGAQGNTIGSTAFAQGNAIRANGTSGIYVADSGHNTILYNGVGENAHYGVLLDGVSTTWNVVSGTTILDNGYDGIAERNGANLNAWTQVSIYNNGGLGIDKDVSDDAANVIHAPAAVITSIVPAGDVVHISGTGLNLSLVEVYQVAPDPSGFGEGKTYVGLAPVTSGRWSLSVPSSYGRCFTLFEIALAVSSSEFGPSSCRTFLPSILK